MKISEVIEVIIDEIFISGLVLEIHWY